MHFVASDNCMLLWWKGKKFDLGVYDRRQMILSDMYEIGPIVVFIVQT